MNLSSMKSSVFTILWFAAFCYACTNAKPQISEFSKSDLQAHGSPQLYKKIDIPSALVAHTDGLTYGGDIRVGDLTNNGTADFLMYRAARGNKEGATKPCFLGAFTSKGEVIWQVGDGGIQPYRPGPVAIHDIDGDGQTEMICFFHADTIDSSPFTMENVRIQIRDGSTGNLEKEVDLSSLMQFEGEGPNWVHHRIFIANFSGSEKPQDFIIKLGKQLVAFDHNLKILWTYFNANDQYQNCPAYIPSVGDIDGDGKDEVNGGYYLLDDDGKVLWEKVLGKNMDAVAITEWDNGQMRAFGSGFGHIMDDKGNVILKLGEEVVPHGQEMQIANFTDSLPGPEMILRYNGHNPDALLVGNDGQVLTRFQLNESPNNTGMTTVFWNGRDKPALLFNGGVLWYGWGEKYAELPGLPPPIGDKKMGWYHCIPADICGDEREEIITYNPWDKYVFVYTANSINQNEYTGYRPGPRQYNVRLMD